jgi:uncharacterized protein YegP (UPF0339 family)
MKQMHRPDLASTRDVGNTGNSSNNDESDGDMAAKFEIRQPKAGEFRWVLTSQGRTLATSEAYTRKVSCVNAIESVRKAAPTAAIADTTNAPSTAPQKAARAAGRAVGKAAAATKQTAKKTTKTVAKAPTATKRTAKTAVKTAGKAAAGATKPGKAAAPRKRASR